MAVVASPRAIVRVVGKTRFVSSGCPQSLTRDLPLTGPY